MKSRNRKTLPKTNDMIKNGGIYLQQVRCGKANCKCARGETHPAYYFFTRVNGKLTKTYVRKAVLEEFAEIVEEATYSRWVDRQVTKISNESIKKARAYLRENKDEIEKRKNELLSQMIKQLAHALIT